MKKWFHLSIEHMPYWLGLASTLIFAFFIAVILPQQSELAIVYGLSESVDTSFFIMQVNYIVLQKAMVH
jgi:hypothetical protein